jgi:hypothetical protein
MHCADRELARRDLDLVAEFRCWNTASFDGVPRPAKLAGRADEDTDLVRLNPLFVRSSRVRSSRLRWLALGPASITIIPALASGGNRST